MVRRVPMRTTTTENGKLPARTAVLFPDVAGYGDVLAALSDGEPSTSRHLSEITGINVRSALSTLRYRALIVKGGLQVRLNDALPFGPEMRAFFAEGASAAQPRVVPSNEAARDVVEHAARLFFRTPSAAYVLIGLSESLLTGPDLRRCGDALCLEAIRLSNAGVVRRTLTHGVTRYELNAAFEKFAQLRDLLAALKPYVPAARIPRHDPDARTNYGTHHYRARLSDETIREIVARRQGGESAAALAREFQITAVYVRALCRSEYRRSAILTQQEDCSNSSLRR